MTTFPEYSRENGAPVFDRAVLSLMNDLWYLMISQYHNKYYYL